MEARVFLTCFLGNNFRRWSRLCDQHAHNNQDLDSQVIIIMWRSILSWLTTCAIINCCVPFWSNSDDISCSLGDGRQYWDNQVESLVYHLLQSVNVYVSDQFFKGYPFCDFNRKLYYFWSDICIFDKIWKDNQGRVHMKITHRCSSAMDHD